MARSTTRRTAAYYSVAIAVLLGTIVLGLLVQSRAAGASWHPSCTTTTVAHQLHPGTGRTQLEKLTGHGHRLMRDQLYTAVAYRPCDPSWRLVVMYDQQRTAVDVWYWQPPS